MRASSFAKFAAITLALAGLATPALADSVAVAGKSALNYEAIAMFGVFVLLTLGITKWAANRTKSASDFYAAGGGITGFQNGLAIAGDYMSAASFLPPPPAFQSAILHCVPARLRPPGTPFRMTAVVLTTRCRHLV